MVYTIVVHFRAKDEPGAIEKLTKKLQEASQVYSQDKETISWFIMRDHRDPRAFTIVERYDNEDSQKYHLENPYWKTFDPYVKPLLDGDMDLRRYHEIDTSEKVTVEDEKFLEETVKGYQRDCKGA
ncbi:hypothetical protein W97_01030 [Coniosporium apollinis CBS 100218]|uniref:ABM domain-containing protein n=1 Tax=Coniosporium apollinis (strain CBS 100218) TaxID=1168221 RepID=R7YIU9_CONA1|nr:uncharacterized protein W97_01030 [Coniosporium apollinis CBS 100218]EON61813.1 hypothetical protein W97_01030 [Coniosporium apollinis CBS 100218]